MFYNFLLEIVPFVR